VELEARLQLYDVLEVFLLDDKRPVFDKALCWHFPPYLLIRLLYFISLIFSFQVAGHVGIHQ